MEWQSTVFWNLCMSMLPHRNTRALLVPVICVALLVPFSATATEASATAAAASASASDGHGLAVPSGYIIGSTLTVTGSCFDEDLRDQVTESLLLLSQQQQSHAGIPTPTSAVEETPFDSSSVFDSGPVRTEPPIDDDDGDEPHQQKALRRQTGVMFLEHGSGSGIVPRKFTIPEPSIVAEAGEKHIAILPAKPHGAVAREQRLMKREGVESSRVALVDTMVLVTVDGRMYGIKRSDGTILWRREGLLDLEHNNTTAESRGMVWTKGRPVAQSKSTASMAGAAAGSLPKLGAEHIVGDEADEDIEDIDDEEEWLLEQGIDWRSDPQVLRQRREWVQRQKAKARARERAKSGQFGRDSNSSFGNAGPENLQDVLYIAEPGSGGGALYLYTLESGLHRLPLTIQDLVDRSPVQVNGVLYTGTKDTHFVAVDLSSGQLLSLYESEGSLGARVLLGEKRNRVRITPTTANSNAIRQSALDWDWELHHRSVDAPALDADIDALLVELGDAAETLSGARGPAKFVTTHDGGFVMVEAQTGMPLWAQRFDSPVVGAFDVFCIEGERYVARRRDLAPAQQQARFRRWQQRLHELDAAHGLDELLAHKQQSQQNRWRTGSAGGNALAGAFWERAPREGLGRPQMAYVGKLRDTLFMLTGDEFPLIDHAALTSSLLLALGQARGNRARYPALLDAAWWDRWAFLTKDAVVLRVLHDARSHWLADSSGSSALAVPLEGRFEQLAAVIERHHMEAAVAAAAEAEQLDARGDIVGVHAIGWAPDLEQQREIGGADETPELPDEGSGDDEAQRTLADEEWRWWRYVGHYTTRVAAFIGYAVTFAVVAMFGGALYLLRPRTKRRARMWIDAAGDDPAAPGRRARLRISWAVMHRMWATLKEEWRLAVDDAWRNPNAAAVLRRTGVQRRASSEALLTSVEADLNTEPKAAAEKDSGADAIENEPSARSSRSSRSSSGGLGLQLPDDSDHSTSLDRLLAGSGTGTPRRNSTGTRPMTPMTPLKLAGAITLTDHVLGYGSHGTIVYRGMFQGRAVAVKRLLLDFYDVADHEVQVLQESDSHPNVIRYFCTERQDHFMYIALELCCGSLADATMRAPKAQLATQLLAQMPKMHVLRQLARGLHHLHALKLVHRDIKPQNILVAPPPHRRRKSRSAADPILGFGDASDYVAGAGAPRVLISDFGLSRILDDDESSFANTFTMHAMPAPHAAAPGAFPLGMIGGFGGGTVGWRAPECFDSPDARFSAAAAADSDQPSWPSLRPNAQPPCDEPSPYVSRGTKSRLHHLAMLTQQQQPDASADEPDSTGTNPATGSNITLPSGSRRRMTRAVDIFSMGCVFYYVLSDGDHPFGDRLSREQHILAGTPDLRALESSGIPSSIEAVDLIAHMVSRQERDRPSAASILVHPYFWDATQRLAFIQDVSDCLEAEARLIKAAREDLPEPSPPLLLAKKPKGAAAKKKGNASGAQQAEAPASAPAGSHAISNESIEDIIARLPVEQAAAVRRAITLLDIFEQNSEFVMEGAPQRPSTDDDGFQVVGMPHSRALDSMTDAVSNKSGGRPPRRVLWDRRLDPHLRRDLGKFRKYDGSRLRDLLRIIRNKKNHYQDMPMPLRETLGDIPDGYLHYFDSRFPYLLLHCYYFVLEDDSLRTATVFRPYFRPPSSHFS